MPSPAMNVARPLLLASLLLLPLVGVALAQTRPPEILRAGGSEPGWYLTIARDGLTFAVQDGQRIVIETPPLTERDGVRVWRTRDGRMTVTATPAYCEDDATGQPHPLAVTVVRAGTSYTGCGGDPGELLRGPAWTVEAIDGVPVPPGATLTFDGDRLQAYDGCNEGRGAFSVADGLRLSIDATTRKACPCPAGADCSLFQSLGVVYGFALGEEGTLVLQLGEGGEIVARR